MAGDFCHGFQSVRHSIVQQCECLPGRVAQLHYGVTANASTLMQVMGKSVQVLMTPFAALMADKKGVSV